MKLNIETIGRGYPKIAVVGCVHGDEVVGQKVINELKKIKPVTGSVSLIVANQLAIKKGKREIKKDLNRSFPGKKNGQAEEKLAYYLKKELNKYDLVIDVHATSSNFSSLAIITRLDKNVKNLLKLVPVQMVALIKKNVFGGHEMITHTKLGIALEYGPNKTGRNYKRALKDVLMVLGNMGVLGGKVQKYPQKELLNVTGVYKIKDGFKQISGLKDFCLIEKGQIIGSVGQKEICSRKSFYPLFLGKGKYRGTLALTANSKKTVML